jgi:hypothetical protein
MTANLYSVGSIIFLLHFPALGENPDSMNNNKILKKGRKCTLICDTCKSIK